MRFVGQSGARPPLLPLINLGSQPELRPPCPPLDHRPRHVRVAPLVDADGVAVGEAKHLSDLGRVKQVAHVHLPAHRAEITLVTGSVRRPG